MTQDYLVHRKHLHLATVCATVETSLRDTHYDKATLDTAKPTTVLASLTGVTTIGTVSLLYYIEPLGILNGKVAHWK